MIIGNYIYIKPNPRALKMYHELGYDCKIGEYFKIHIINVPLTSRQKFKVECDYCGEICEKDMSSYLESRKYSNKDCCKKCSPLKQKETCMSLYGVECNLNLKEYQENRPDRIKWKDIIKLFDENYPNLILVSKEEDFINTKKSTIKYLCVEHLNEGVQHREYKNLAKNDNCCCKYCNRENYSERRKLYENGNNEINKYLRTKTYEWRKDTIKKYGYKCFLSNITKNIQIHHLYGFNKIVDETFRLTNIQTKEKVSDYTKEELIKLEETFINLHYKYGLGVCITKKLHKLFHKLYGSGGNTPEQFEEFKQRYNLGEFLKLN